MPEFRLIRMRDAPKYLGMNKHLFNREVRPYITEIPIGSHGIAFDRLDLDAWVEQTKSRNRKVVKLPDQNRRHSTWRKKEARASITEEASGTLERPSSAEDFLKALRQIRSQKQKST